MKDKIPNYIEIIKTNVEKIEKEFKEKAERKIIEYEIKKLREKIEKIGKEINFIDSNILRNNEFTEINVGINKLKKKQKILKN